jgi:hypothetical protein
MSIFSLGGARAGTPRQVGRHVGGYGAQEDGYRRGERRLRPRDWQESEARVALQAGSEGGERCIRDEEEWQAHPARLRCRRQQSAGALALEDEELRQSQWQGRQALGRDSRDQEALRDQRLGKVAADQLMPPGNICKGARIVSRRVHVLLHVGPYLK